MHSPALGDPRRRPGAAHRAGPAEAAMSNLLELRPGQRVRISHPQRGECEGLVLHVETPAALPSISGAAEIDLVRAILAERDVHQLALIEHWKEGVGNVGFIAFGDGNGRWWDLRQQ